MRLHVTCAQVCSHALVRKVRPSLCRFSSNSHVVQLLVISLLIPGVPGRELDNETTHTKEKEDLKKKKKRKLTRSNSEKRYSSISLISSPHNICSFFCVSLYIQTSILKARLVSVRSLLSCLLMNVYRVIILRDNHRLPLAVYSFMVLAWIIQPRLTTRDRVPTGRAQKVVVRQKKDNNSLMSSSTALFWIFSRWK